jgi:CHAT domain-containing protein/tetratricopeptide (TPR) repeat protein
MGVGGAVPAAAQAPDSAAVRARAEARLAAADSLRAARRFGPARDAYRRARALYRQIADSAAAAEMTGNVGTAYYLDGQLDAARSAFQRAARAARAAGARAEAASNLNNVGLVEWQRGQYDAALTHIREAVRLQRALGNREQVATGLNNLANIQEERGRYDKALENLRSALNINRTQDDRLSVANNLNNIGLILRSQGRLEAALERHRAALEIHRALDARSEVAADLNNIGLILRMEERYDEALGHYREALELNRALDRPSNVASNRSNIGTLLREQGHYEAALAHHRKALAVHRERGERARVATDLISIGQVYAARRDRAAALERYRTALAINRALDRRHAIAVTLENMGRIYLERGALATADSVFSEAVRVTDTLLQTASGDPRRDFLAKEVDRFQALSLTRARMGRPEAALRVYERSRARLLAERLAGGGSATALAVPPVDSLRATVRPDEAAVLYAHPGPERPLLTMVVTRDTVRTRETSTAPLRRAAERYEPALDRLRRQEKIPWIERRPSPLREAKGVEVGSGAEGALANLVRLYRHDLSVPPAQQLLSPDRRRHLGQVLYTVLIDPIEPVLADRDGLVVVPDGALGYLPFEALSDWDRTRLVERWRVRYTPSLRVLHLLRRRDPPGAADDRRPLLALGGVVYDASPDTAGAEDSRAAGRRTGPAAGAAGSGGGTTGPAPLRSGADGRPASTYRRLGYGPDRWQNIPGTLREARALRRVTGAARLLTGPDASEHALHQLSSRGDLDDYRALHFATHGFLVSDAPALSALVLAEVGRTPSGERGPLPQTDDPDAVVPDGYLSMREIVELDLNAEFVGLSACRTGLGRIYRGSGAVSLAQAFLRAGAGSAAVSLWAVYDASTSRFMEAVYRRAWARDTSWASAIAETKRAFIAGHYGERLRAPRFWAPFVHHGRDAGQKRAEESGAD